MELNEIIALAIVIGVIGILVLYEVSTTSYWRRELREAKESARKWAAMYRLSESDRVILQHRVNSKDCQKVICYQTELDAARDEIKRLTALNENYKRQLERDMLRGAAE